MAKQMEDLGSATVTDLRDRAKDAGITGASHMRKDELIEALSNAGEHKPTRDRSKERAHGSASEDVLELLKQDHDNVKALFSKALNEDAAADGVAELAEQIVAELELHTQAEETIVYPALKEKAVAAAAGKAKDDVLEAYVEHGSVKELIARIESMSPDDESYKAVLTVMREQVEHHIEEEESEMFKQARRLFEKEELTDLGARVAELKASAKQSR